MPTVTLKRKIERIARLPFRMKSEQFFASKYSRLILRFEKLLWEDLQRTNLSGRLSTIRQAIQKAGPTSKARTREARYHATLILGSYYVSRYFLEERMRLRQDIQKYITFMFEFGAVESLGILGFSASSKSVDNMKQRLVVQKAAEVVFELTDQEIKDAAYNRSILVSQMTTDAIINEARRRIVQDVFLGTSSTQAVAESLSATKGFPLWYSHRIARTEAQQAFQLAMFNTYERSGVRRHSWLTVGDRRVREEHVENEAQGTIRLGEFFSSGEQYPGQTSVNCRCSLIPELSDPNILLKPWSGGSGPYPVGRDVPSISPIPRPIMIKR